jgi:hypothetical protein
VATDPLRACSVLPQSIWIENNQTSPKVSDIATWPCPRSAKELHSFLGLASYYRKFVRHFGVLSKPLTSLLKKHTIFIWTSVQDQAFQALKEALCFVPVLKLPDFSRSFAIETDACATGIGAVLTQDGHPIAFISKALGPKSQGLSTYEKYGNPYGFVSVACISSAQGVHHPYRPTQFGTIVGTTPSYCLAAAGVFHVVGPQLPYCVQAWNGQSGGRRTLLRTFS